MLALSLSISAEEGVSACAESVSGITMRCGGERRGTEAEAEAGTETEAEAEAEIDVEEFGCEAVLGAEGVCKAAATEEAEKEEGAVTALATNIAAVGRAVMSTGAAAGSEEAELELEEGAEAGAEIEADAEARDAGTEAEPEEEEKEEAVVAAAAAMCAASAALGV